MIDPFIECSRRVIALADIAEAVEQFQRGESGVEQTLERIAGALAKTTIADGLRSAA
jgi:hypothetical protein